MIAPPEVPIVSGHSLRTERLEQRSSDRIQESPQTGTALFALPEAKFPRLSLLPSALIDCKMCWHQREP